MSRETVEYLLGLLNLVNLSGGAPDFREQAQKLIKAREELEAELK